jgi:hypothetical protein
MSDDDSGGGGGAGGILGFVGILVAVNALSYFFNWGFWLY